MSLDRFIKFDGDYPTRDEIESVLRNFFGTAGEVKWSGDRFFVTLPGKTTFPYAGIEPFAGKVDVEHRTGRERWIEICPGNPMDVITRRQDPFTNALAEGLAKTFARFWEGKIDD